MSPPHRHQWLQWTPPGLPLSLPHQRLRLHLMMPTSAFESAASLPPDPRHQGRGNLPLTAVLQQERHRSASLLADLISHRQVHLPATPCYLWWSASAQLHPTTRISYSPQVHGLRDDNSNDLNKHLQYWKLISCNIYSYKAISYDSLIAMV
jgi:hypothetical protein